MQRRTTDIQALKRLIHSPQFHQIIEQCRASRTTLGVLQDAFHENVLSRILRYLCSTSETHGLGDAFLREWLKQIRGCPIKLGQGLRRIDAHFNWRVTSQSETNRYIDLVLLVQIKASSTPIAVVGVETKIDAPESDSQIEDYQLALAKTFRNVTERGLFYLTPDGKRNKTGKATDGCPCYDVSYDSLIRTCDRLTATDRRVLNAPRRRTIALLRDLSQFLSKDLMKNTQRSQIDELLKKLESKEETARALDILTAYRYRPTIRSFVYELLLPKIREEFGDVEIAWHYPKSSARPNEFNFEHADIKVKLPINTPYEIYYMIYSSEGEPTSGDPVSVLLMARRRRPGKISPKLQTRLNSIREELPTPEGDAHQWGPWTCLWSSATHRLGKFNDAETEELFQLYKRTVDRTKPRLLRALRNS